MPSGPRTELKELRAEQTEVCRAKGLGLNDTHPAKPPWWVVRYKGKHWSNTTWNYIWTHYGGPPMVFLTRKNAGKEAQKFKKQYGKGTGPYSKLIVEVVRLIPTKIFKR